MRIPPSKARFCDLTRRSHVASRRVQPTPAAASAKVTSAAFTKSAAANASGTVTGCGTGAVALVSSNFGAIDAQTALIPVGSL